MDTLRQNGDCRSAFHDEDPSPFVMLQKAEERLAYVEDWMLWHSGVCSDVVDDAAEVKNSLVEIGQMVKSASAAGEVAVATKMKADFEEAAMIYNELDYLVDHLNKFECLFSAGTLLMEDKRMAISNLQIRTTELKQRIKVGIGILQSAGA